MFRYLLAFMILAGTGAAQAQTATPAKPASPGEMAAYDRDKAEKRAACLKQSKLQTPKLGFVARRKFVSNCVKN